MSAVVAAPARVLGALVVVGTVVSLGLRRRQLIEEVGVRLAPSPDAPAHSTTTGTRWASAHINS